MMRGRSLGAVLAFWVAVGLASCIGGSPACDTLPTRIELTVSAESLTPDDPTTCRGREVTLVISAHVDGVFHVHGLDAELPATTVTDGDVVELVFTAGRSGQFPIELHTDENTEGVSVGILTVHEP